MKKQILCMPSVPPRNTVRKFTALTLLAGAFMGSSAFAQSTCADVTTQTDVQASAKVNQNVLVNSANTAANTTAQAAAETAADATVSAQGSAETMAELLISAATSVDIESEVEQYTEFEGIVETGDGIAIDIGSMTETSSDIETELSDSTLVAALSLAAESATDISAEAAQNSEATVDAATSATLQVLADSQGAAGRPVCCSRCNACQLRL